jgi:hypothetical protein
MSTPEQMTRFAKGFSKEEWITLCKDKEFLILLTDDLDTCRLHAERVLGAAKKKQA